MRSLLITIGLCVSVWLSAAAQNAQPPAQFTAQTDLVLVPVEVRKSGSHVAGLKQSDFSILLDGKTQTASVFEEVHTGTPQGPLPAAASDPHLVSNDHGRGSVQRITIIALDMVNTPVLDQAYVKDEVDKFLASLKNTGEPLALVSITRSGVRVLRDFTSDPREIAVAAKRVKPEHSVAPQPAPNMLDQGPNLIAPPTDPTNPGPAAAEIQRQIDVWLGLMVGAQEAQDFQTDTSRLDTMAALRQLAEALHGFPGRKTLIWISSGVQVMGGLIRFARTNGGVAVTGDYGVPMPVGAAAQSVEQLQHTFQVLSDANIAVYPVDARHGADPNFSPYNPANPNMPAKYQTEMARDRDQEVVDTFVEVAAATGGRPCYRQTNLARCLGEAVDDSRDYYMLGFYAPKKLALGPHKIEVKLNQKADLRYRSTLLIAASDPDKRRLTDLQLALLSPVEFTAMPVSARLTPGEKNGRARKIEVEVGVPSDAVELTPDGKLLFDIVVVVRSAEGKEAARVAQRFQETLSPAAAGQIRASGIHYRNQIELEPGNYGVWIVVRGNVTGRTGSAVTTLRVD